MLEEIKWMLQLQEKDQKITALGKELERIPRETAEAESRLKRDQETADAVRGRIQENEVAMKNLELDIETRRTTITKLKIQQYETKKNEEFRALGNEVIRYGEEVVALEDRELELMEKGEKMRKEWEAAEARRNQTKAQVEEEVAGHAVRAEGSKRRIAELREERKAIAGRYDADLNGLYDRILKSKGDAAVAALEHGICGGCHMKVTKTTLHSVKLGEALTQCENCGRVLYWVE